MLASNNTSDAIDIGFYGQYVSTGTKYTGLVRTAANNYTLFQGVTTNPTSNANTVLGISYANYATLNANIAAGQITSVVAIPVSSGGTGVTTSTGTGSVVLSISPTLVTPALGTPSSGTLTNCTFPTLNQNTTGTAAGLSSTLSVASGGTGVTTSTGTGSVVLSISPTLVTPALGTPSSGNLSNCTFPTLNQNTTGSSGSCTGNAATANVATNATNVYVNLDETTNTTRYVPYASTVAANSAINGSSRLTFNPSTGDFTAAGNITAFSDERVKINWRGFGVDFIGRLAQVKSGVYDRTDSEATQVGVSAQSLQSLMPNAVIEDNEGMLSVAYGNAALVSSIELAKEVVDLKNRLAELERIIAKLQ